MKNSIELIPGDFDFFLSSTCTIFFWNSITVRTARNRGIRSYSWSSHVSPLVHIPWSLAPWSSPFSLVSNFFILYIGFSTILPLYLFLNYVSFLCTLSQKLKCTHRFPTSSVLGAALLGCLWLTFSYSTILPYARRGNYACLLLILTHITLQ